MTVDRGSSRRRRSPRQFLPKRLPATSLHRSAVWIKANLRKDKDAKEREGDHDAMVETCVAREAIRKTDNYIIIAYFVLGAQEPNAR